MKGSNRKHLGAENPMTRLLPILLFLSCSHPSEPAAQSDMDAVRAQRDVFCQTFDPQSVERCDRVTFLGLMSAACGRDYGLSQYEENGKWHRDETHKCYEEGESKSQCSLDGYLSVLHASVGNGSGDYARRILSHLEKQVWLCGEGPTSVTDISKLRSVIEHMSTGSSLVDDSADASITGFRGHLAAMYFWLRNRIGLKSVVGDAALALLYAENTSSPLYAALAGDESGAVRNLMHFPAPYSQFWGSAPDSVIYAASVAVLEGR